MIKNLISKYFASISGLIVFLVYLFTLAPTVVKIDSGELAAVQYTLGVAHPTGYPVFTIIGYLFQQISLPLTPIYKSNILSAVFCSIATIFFIKAAFNFLFLSFSGFYEPIKTKNKKEKKNSVSEKPMLKETHLKFSAVLSGFILSFSKTYWLQSTSVEVYSLQLLFFSLILLALSRISKNILNGEYSFNNWIFLSISFAFGFLNHMTTLLFIPAAIYLFSRQYKIKAVSFIDIIKFSAVFTIILAAGYSYILLRAQQNPYLNWGNADNITRLFRHISGKQYSVWMFTGIDAAKKHLFFFFKNYITEFRAAAIAIIITGLIISFRKSSAVERMLFITFVFAVLFTINYDISDIETYFLSALIISAIWFSFGVYWLLERFSERKLNIAISFPILLLPLLFEVYFNYSEVDQSENYFYNDYTKSLLSSVEKNSIILSYQWDYFISSSLYFQKAENFRPDAAVIDKELLRRSWYFKQIYKSFPGVLIGLDYEINSFLKELEVFESGGNFNPQVLELYFRKIITGLIKNNVSKRNVYIGPEFLQKELRTGELQLPEDCTLVPHLFLYKVVKKDEYSAAPFPDFKLRKTGRDDNYEKNASAFVFDVLINRALYENQNGFNSSAQKYLNFASNNFPEFSINPTIINLLKNDKK
ncbi:MAG: DUF2723 domain-containing protein [Ignavibacteria bacterium]|nr:DUF2723 domain-containing protein [Ignavibacteria bacterium]